MAKRISCRSFHVSFIFKQVLLDKTTSFVENHVDCNTLISSVRDAPEISASSTKDVKAEYEAALEQLKRERDVSIAITM